MGKLPKDGDAVMERWKERLLRRYAARPQVVLACFENPSLTRCYQADVEMSVVIPARWSCDEILIGEVKATAFQPSTLIVGSQRYAVVDGSPDGVAVVVPYNDWYLGFGKRFPDDVPYPGRIEVLGWWIDDEDVPLPAPRCHSKPCKMAHRGDVVEARG